jgi:hypothetical protein
MRNKNLFVDAIGHSATVIGHGHVYPVSYPLDLYSQDSAFRRKRVEGVEDEIGEYLKNLRCEYRRKSRTASSHLNGNALFPGLCSVWDCSPGLALWPYQVSDRSLLPGQSWALWQRLGVGGAVGGIVGALVGMGIPEYEAKRYEGAVKGGGTLLSVHCDTSEQMDAAKASLKGTGASDISSAHESGTDDKSGERGTFGNISDENRVVDRTADEPVLVEKSSVR